MTLTERLEIVPRLYKLLAESSALAVNCKDAHFMTGQIAMESVRDIIREQIDEIEGRDEQKPGEMRIESSRYMP